MKRFFPVAAVPCLLLGTGRRRDRTFHISASCLPRGGHSILLRAVQLARIFSTSSSAIKFSFLCHHPQLATIRAAMPNVTPDKSCVFTYLLAISHAVSKHRDTFCFHSTCSGSSGDAHNRHLQKLNPIHVPRNRHMESPNHLEWNRLPIA